MPARFVIPYLKSQKNDSNDAEAICEAVTRPIMRFVAIKSAEQRAVLCLHRLRRGLIKDRTARINRLRGLLVEYSFVAPQGRYPSQATMMANNMTTLVNWQRGLVKCQGSTAPAGNPVWAGSVNKAIVI